jgi:hypothetical protein
MNRLAAILKQFYNVDSSAVPSGGILSLYIANTVPTDPVAGVGASGSGWVAIVTLKGLTAASLTVTPSDLTLTVQDPGFDTAGNQVTVTRTISGVAHLRRLYPNGALRQAYSSGTSVTVLVSLSDWIYSESIVTAATIGTAFYPGCAAGGAFSITNTSTLPYQKPLWAWINPQQESTSGTANVEGVAFHRHARNAQQVACVKYTASDGTATSPTVISASPSISARITNGQPPEVWKGAVDFTTLTQGVMCNVNAKVYPWIGNSSAVLDLAADGFTWPTGKNRTQLRVFNDRTGAYGGGFAYVLAGATGGVTSAAASTARATPYPTIFAALTGLRAWNNTNKGHNDIGGGTVRLMDAAGSPVTHTIANSFANAPGLTYCYIEKDPLNTATVTVTFSVQSSLPSMIMWRNLSITPTAQLHNVVGYDGPSDIVVFDGITFDNTAGKNISVLYAYKYILNCIGTGTSPVTFNALPSLTACIVSLIGYTANAAALPAGNNSLSVAAIHALIGCSIPKYAALRIGTANGSTEDGRIIYNNKLYYGSSALSTANTILEGVANVQNVYETDALTANQAMAFYADGDLTSISNYIEMHNTAIGERCSRMYNDSAAAKVAPIGVVKQGIAKYNILDNYNIKGDTFNTGAGSVGNWAYMYSVGNVGNVCLFGAVNRVATDAPHNDNADVPYLGMAWLPTSEYNLQRTGIGLSKAAIMGLFTNYTVAPQTTPAIGGSYIPVAGAAPYFKNRVLVSEAVLKFDLAGNLRKNDGTGAPGAYEMA